MKKKCFNESQILAVLKKYEAGVSPAYLARKYSIGESTIYNWNSKYASMGLSELKRLHQLEDKNNRLKRMYATLSMDNELFGRKLNVDLHDEKWYEN